MSQVSYSVKYIVFPERWQGLHVLDVVQAEKLFHLFTEYLTFYVNYFCQCVVKKKNCG